MFRYFGSDRPECVRYKQIVVFAMARSRRERDRTRDCRHFILPEPIDRHGAAI